jgi:SAM-dependent methyltransferase
MSTKAFGPLTQDAFLHIVRTRYFPEIWYALENWFQLIKKRKRVLEAGYGIGLVAEALAKSGWEVTAIDPSTDALAALRHKFSKGSLGGDFEQADVDKLPFANQSFDAVVSINAIEFAQNPLEAVQEITRVLVPGGRAVIATFNKLSPWGIPGVVRLLRPEANVPTPRFFTKNDLTKIIKTSGLVLEDVKERAGYLPSKSALGKLKLPVAGAFVALVSKEGAPKGDATNAGDKGTKSKNFILET